MGAQPEADPRAILEYRGTRLEVRARPAGEAEQAEVLARSEEIYLGYRKYQIRITDRKLRIFVLEALA